LGFPPIRIIYKLNFKAMKEISDIKLSRISNGAHVAFILDFITVAKEDEKITAAVPELLSALEKAIATECDVFKVSRKSFKTDDIAKADNERDTYYAAYKRAVQGYLRLNDGKLSVAAKVLAQHIKDYSISVKVQLDKETGLLKNFIGDLETKYAAQVEALNLTPFVVGLKDANERVHTYTVERTLERTSFMVGAMKSARRATNEAYRAVVKMLNARALVFGDSDYALFFDRINAKIKEFKRDVLTKSSSSHDDEEQQ
jgi:hypothetical protein